MGEIVWVTRWGVYRGGVLQRVKGCRTSHTRDASADDLRQRTAGGNTM